MQSCEADASNKIKASLRGKYIYSVKSFRRIGDWKETSEQAVVRRGVTNIK